MDVVWNSTFLTSHFWFQFCLILHSWSVQIIQDRWVSTQMRDQPLDPTFMYLYIFFLQKTEGNPEFFHILMRLSQNDVMFVDHQKWSGILKFESIFAIKKIQMFRQCEWSLVPKKKEKEKKKTNLTQSAVVCGSN